MKYDLVENGTDPGGYSIQGDSVVVILPDRSISIPLEHCNFKDERLFCVRPVAMLPNGVAVPMNRYKLWME